MAQPSATSPRVLTADRCDRIATMASLEELSGVDWAIARGFAAPLASAEAQAMARRRAELGQASARRLPRGAGAR